jgi:hypothetical protein
VFLAACNSENSFADRMTVSIRPSFSTKTGSVLAWAHMAPKRFLAWVAVTCMFNPYGLMAILAKVTAKGD